MVTYTFEIQDEDTFPVCFDFVRFIISFKYSDWMKHDRNTQRVIFSFICELQVIGKRRCRKSMHAGCKQAGVCNSKQYRINYQQLIKSIGLAKTWTQHCSVNVHQFLHITIHSIFSFFEFCFMFIMINV